MSRAIERKQLDEARVIAHAVALLAEQASLGSVAALAHKTEARVHHLGEDMARARVSFAAAVAVERGRGDEHAALRTEIAVAFLLYDEGDGASASAMLDDIEARAVEHVALLAPQLAGYRGNLARQRGEHTQAHALYAQAIEGASARGDALFSLVFAMDDGITTMLEGDAVGALASLTRTMDSVLALPASDGRVVLASTLRHYLTLVRLALGVPVDDVLDGPPSASLRAMRETLSRARSEITLAELEEVGLHTEHARLTRTLIERITRARSEHARVIVQRDARFVVCSEGRVDLSQRQALRNLLRALIDTLPTEGRAPALRASALIAAGWPGEQILPRAAKNRLHVALTTLRQLGLGAAIRLDEHAYALDPEIVRIVG